MIAPMFAVAERHAPTLASLVGTHAFDLKLDGVRCLAYCTATGVELRNRNGVDITHRYPDVVAQLSSLPPTVLDGEVVAHDESFESIALRDRQEHPAKVAAMMAKIPARFIAFDVLHINGADTTGEPWIGRRQILDLLQKAGKVETVPWSTDPALYETVRETKREGIIAKRLSARYQPGRRSPDWIKFKCTYRVSCVPVGYDAGTGGRAHFGAMHLAMIGDSGPVIVGRVGTGFNAREIDELKGRLDRRELFVVEIECANRTKGDQLRFPVYKGIRSDLSPADATTVQLASLPTC